MKPKRIVSVLLILAMLTTLFQLSAFAVEVTKVPLEGYEVKVVAKQQKLGSVDGIVFDVQLKGAKYAAFDFLLSLDKNLIVPANRNTGAALTTSAPIAAFIVAKELDDFSQFAITNSVFKQSATRNFVRVYGTLSGNATEVTAGGFASVATVYTRLVDGKTVSDLTQSALRLGTQAELADAGGTYTMMISNQDKLYKCDQTDLSNGDTAYWLERSQFTLEPSGFELPGAALASIAVTAPGTTDVKVPGASGNNVTLQFTAKGTDTEGGEVTTLTNPTWKIVETDSATAAAATITGVSINNSGLVTITKAAKALTTGDHTYYVVCSSGSVNSTPVPFKVTKDAPAVDSVALNPTSVAAKLPAVGASATSDYTVTATVKDQYGDNMNGQTVTTSGLPSGVTYADGKIKVSASATATTSAATVTFACSGKSANLSLTIAKGDAPAAPTVTATGVTGEDTNDGKISGVNNTMEYRKQGDANWTPVTGTEITGLAAGTYEVRVKETTNTKAGNAATVTVAGMNASDAPVISAQPAAKTGVKGDEVTFSVTASPATGYQWQKKGPSDADFANIDGATSASYTHEIAGIVENGTQFRCVVTNQEAGKGPATATTDAATLTVNKIVLAGALNPPVKDITEEGHTLADATPDAPVTLNGVPGTFAWDDDDTTEVEQGAEYAWTFTIDDAVKDDYENVEVHGAAIPWPKDDDVRVYTVTFDAGKNGTLNGDAVVRVTMTASPKKVPTVTAKEGYKFKGWSLDGKTVVDPKTVKVTSHLTFVALYEKDGIETYINGLGNGKFGPNNKATRADVATMLARLSKGYDPNGTYTGSASDLGNQWYATAIKFMLQKGIMTGYEDGTVKAEKNITRGEFAAMLCRTLGLEQKATGTLKDAKGWSAGYVNALQAAGIVTGYEDGTFRPNQYINRAEVVTMINKAYGIKGDGDYTVTFTDVAKGQWYYEAVMAASNTDISGLKK